MPKVDLAQRRQKLLVMSVALLGAALASLAAVLAAGLSNGETIGPAWWAVSGVTGALLAAALIVVLGKIRREYLATRHDESYLQAPPPIWLLVLFLLLAAVSVVNGALSGLWLWYVTAALGLLGALILWRMRRGSLRHPA